MSQYVTTVKRMAQEVSDPQVVTDWRCRAHGCPNSGSMEGKICFFHWRESDPSKWAGVTQMIRENFGVLRNWGQLSDEQQAKYRANSQKLFPGVKSGKAANVLGAA